MYLCGLYVFRIAQHFVLTWRKRFYVMSESMKSDRIRLEILENIKSVSDPLCTKQTIIATGQLTPKPHTVVKLIFLN